MTGAKTLADHIVPTLREAAAAAGRTSEVVAGFPMAVTSDVARTRAYATESLQVYGGVTSYRAMLDREGLREAGDIAIIGDEDEVAAQIDALAATGIDELAVNVLRRDPDDVARTRAFLRRYLAAPAGR
jgi:5,10-methylenetetrahydromethanopterin reductase